MTNTSPSNIEMITCSQCNEIPEVQPLYQCNLRHIICESCYLDVNIHESAQSICPICGDHNLFRNLLAEEKLKQYLHTHGMRASGSSPKKQKTKTLYTGHYPCTLHATPSLLNISKKPVKCPNTRCSKMIAITQLVSHFSFDHSRTPQDFLNFDQDKVLELSLNSMNYSESHIIALLMVPVTIEKDCSGQENGFVFPLLAAKMSMSCKTPEAVNANNLVIIWVSGNMEDSFTCTIEVSDDDKSIIYAYHGPINALRDSNKPSDVFLRADCLLLHSNSVRKMTQNSMYPMELKVRISCKS